MVVAFDARGLSRGVYLYRIDADGYMQVLQMTLAT
jgi:hypothetical protein